MPYLFVGIIIASFASGYGFAYKVSQAKIQHMSDSIDAMNQEAEWTLAALTKEADKAHEEALKLNKELEDANVSAINAINSQHDSFKSVRMYDNSRKSSSCPPTKGDNTSSTAGATEDRHELSDELTNFLKSEAYRADQIAAYAALCQKFVVDNNCGISK
jgi:cell division protein ZapA (FtsZ GTPase activity inhibitor)